MREISQARLRNLGLSCVLMMLLVPILVLLNGCTGTPHTSSFGNSKAELIHGDRITITETFDNDKVTERVTSCTGRCRNELSDSRDSGRNFADWLKTIAGVMAGAVLF